MIRTLSSLSPRLTRSVFALAFLTLGTFGILVAAPHSARAETTIFTQDLTRCIVKSVSADDKVALARWMMGAMAHHPSLQDLATVTPETKVALNQKMAGIVQRLLLTDCQKEAKDVAKYDQSGFFQSFSVLGSVAMSEIMSNPVVAQAVEDYAQYIDESKINTTLGITPQNGTPPANSDASSAE